MNNKTYNITLVDDDQFLLNMYSMKFSRAGMNVTTISSPEEALEKFRGGHKADILLLDVVMPGMDGIELVSKIKEEQLVQNAVIIIISNQSQQEDIDKAKKLGVDGYIVKATSVPSEVLKEVLRIVEEKQK